VLLTASVVVGYLIRIGLRRFIKRSEAQAQGQILRNKLNAELGRNPDTAFQAAMAGTADDLETALGEDDPATIEAAVKAAHTKLDAELAALQTRADAVRVRLSTLDALIARSWSVPPSVGPVLATASDEVDAARTALYARDVGAASDATTGLEQHLAGRIAEPARDWRDAVLPLVDVLIDQGPAAPGALDKHVQDAAAAASTALVDPVLTASDATVENLLKGVHTATNAIDRLLGATAAAADETGRQVMYRLSTAGVPDAELEVIRIQRAELGSAFDEAEEMGTGSFTSVMSRLSELGAKMRQVIEKNQRQDADLPAVTAALLRGDFVAAAFTATTPAAPQLEQVQALMGNIAQVGNLVVAARTGPAVGGTQARSDVPAASSAPLPRVAIDRLAPLEELGIARRAAARARHARNFVLGVAVIFVGYLLFADDWTGTTTDLAKVFAWGFGAHFTSDFVATQLAQRTGTSTDSGTGTATTTGNSPTPQAPGQQPPPAQPPAGGGAAGNAAGADGQPAPAAPVPAA
jgi:hypothetical protein